MTSTLNTRPPIWNGRVAEFAGRQIRKLTRSATANRRWRWPGLVVLGVACTICAAASAEPTEPVGWRGDGSGRYPLADPVTSWSSDQNILWKTEVGKGNSTPVVVGSRVFLTSEPDVLICVDAESGRELWRRAHRPAVPLGGPRLGVTPSRRARAGGGRTAALMVF